MSVKGQPYAACRRWAVLCRRFDAPSATVSASESVVGQRARNGVVEDWAKLLDTLVTASKQRYVCPLNLALAYIGVGDTTQFYRALGQAVDEHSFIITVGVLRVDPVFDFARKDPRFTALWKKTGLP